MNAFEYDKRFPLFPEVPPQRAPVNYTAIDNKPVTPQRLRDLQRTDRKRDLHEAIVAIYRDCEEHFRPLYQEHLRVLFQQYISELTEMVSEAPQEVTYPTYLLSAEATPNEYLNGALTVLSQEKLTPFASHQVAQAPDRVLKERCPAERSAFVPMSPFTFASFEDLAIPIERKVDTLGKSDADLISRALKTAHDRCRPSIRAFYVRYMRNVAARAVAIKDRKNPQASDALLEEKLKSKDRATLYAGVTEAFEMPAITDTVSALLPEATSSLFYDRCPAIPEGGELAAYRAEYASDLARSEQYRREREQKARSSKAH